MTYAGTGWLLNRKGQVPLGSRISCSSWCRDEERLNGEVLVSPIANPTQTTVRPVLWLSGCCLIASQGSGCGSLCLLTYLLAEHVGS